MNKILKYFLLSIIAFVFLAWLSVFLTLNMYRFKTTDPRDPAYKAENFRYADYFYNKAIPFGEAKRLTFPAGTSKSFVDFVLVDGNGAKVVDLNESLEMCREPLSASRYLYVIKPWWETPLSMFKLNLGGYATGIVICFDKENKLTSL